ncbi:MAG: NrtA/SsuA/CpmA family ABC transporter substrate-binding protein [Myxococcales bacterium]
MLDRRTNHTRSSANHALRRLPMRAARLHPLLLAALLVACSKGNAADRRREPVVGGYEPVTLRFSDPENAGIWAYAKHEKLLEPELAKVNAKIEWVPAAGAFSANFEAMNTGAINASGGAISPVVGALSHNLNFKIYAIGDPSDMRQAGIIVPNDSPIKSPQDLIGKRVAVNAAAHGDYLLLKLLSNHHIPVDKVERVPIQPPEAAAAFATGKIDAWSTFGVFFSTAVKNGAHVIAYEAELDSDDVTILAANAEVLAKNPAAFQALLRVAQRLAQEAHAQPEKFVNVFTDKGPSAVSGERLEYKLAETRATPVPRVPNPHDRGRVANVIKLFFENHSIDRNLSVDNVVFDIEAAARAKQVTP